MKIHSNIPCSIAYTKRLTPDAREIGIQLPDDIDFAYLPGQFINLTIDQPRETAEWFIVKPSHICEVLVEGESKTVAEIAQTIGVTEDAVLPCIKKLQKIEALSVEEEGCRLLKKKEEVTVTMPPFQRSYSLGSTPTKPGVISTMVKEMPGGFMSRYLNSDTLLQEGDEVTVSGPFGHFYFEEGMSKEVILLGAGSGITPLMGILRYIADTGAGTNATLLYSNKVPESIIYKEELENLSKECAQIDVIHTLTRASESEHPWDGRQGRIDAALVEEVLKNKEEALFYICGPLAFGKSMRSLLLDEVGLSKEQVKMEAYG